VRGFRAKPPAFAQLGVARAKIGVARPAAVAYCFALLSLPLLLCECISLHVNR
jgi:hypothetical protein